MRGGIIAASRWNFPATGTTPVRAGLGGSGRRIFLEKCKDRGRTQSFLTYSSRISIDYSSIMYRLCVDYGYTIGRAGRLRASAVARLLCPSIRATCAGVAYRLRRPITYAQRSSVTAGSPAARSSVRAVRPREAAMRRPSWPAAARSPASGWRTKASRRTLAGGAGASLFEGASAGARSGSVRTVDLAIEATAHADGSIAWMVSFRAGVVEARFGRWIIWLSGSLRSMADAPASRRVRAESTP